MKLFVPHGKEKRLRTLTMTEDFEYIPKGEKSSAVSREEYRDLTNPEKPFLMRFHANLLRRRADAETALINAARENLEARKAFLVAEDRLRHVDEILEIDRQQRKAEKNETRLRLEKSQRDLEKAEEMENLAYENQKLELERANAELRKKQEYDDLPLEERLEKEQKDRLVEQESERRFQMESAMQLRKLKRELDQMHDAEIAEYIDMVKKRFGRDVSYNDETTWQDTDRRYFDDISEEFNTMLVNLTNAAP